MTLREQYGDMLGLSSGVYSIFKPMATKGLHRIGTGWNSFARGNFRMVNVGLHNATRASEDIVVSGQWA